jgi:hypothetical protein
MCVNPWQWAEIAHFWQPMATGKVHQALMALAHEK